MNRKEHENLVSFIYEGKWPCRIEPTNKYASEWSTWWCSYCGWIDTACKGHDIPLPSLNKKFFMECLLKLDELGFDYEIRKSTHDYSCKKHMLIPFGEYSVSIGFYWWNSGGIKNLVGYGEGSTKESALFEAMSSLLTGKEDLI